ncbi:RNA polymerase subunit sigma [Psychromonas sp. MB-3u-54]|uniref:sigma-70 family RNA polymerase sigma factor n=1 Tax=Psychromonas sp. MB-3u-54 TaxID=2058319 RepID=UPI000C32311D|nr:sigma-70 family RNA polymerase sigma factor [Psychromonas sp. MB-3u-54]PKH02914.1 RNA polymerase subunit sigma [Psychromonas sp. MB-3u-54]
MIVRIAHNSTDITLNNTKFNSLDGEQLKINSWLKLVATKQDKQAFSELFKWFAPRIRAHGLQRFKQEALAMDLVQETMLLVWRKAVLFNADKGKASTWIYTIMRNYCFDMLRKKQTQKEDTISDDLWPVIEQQTPDDNNDHLQNRLLLSHLGSLSLQQKQVVEAIYLQEMTQQELATHLDLPLGTVKSRLRLAISKLKSKLEADLD